VHAHRADFKVTYRFYDEKEGGRLRLPIQGYRSDFWYDNPEHSGTNKVFMIWPEFEDENGDVIIDTNKQISKIGKAKMWIVNPKMRNYHKEKIEIGLKGFFMEGSRRVAECEIIEMMDLRINPTEFLK
jgi:hypothetical protein